MEFCNVQGPADGDEDERLMSTLAGICLGGAEAQNPEELLESAVQVAKDADVVIAVVGLNANWCAQSPVTRWNRSDASRI